VPLRDPKYLETLPSPKLTRRSLQGNIVQLEGSPDSPPPISFTAKMVSGKIRKISVTTASAGKTAPSLLPVRTHAPARSLTSPTTEPSSHIYGSLLSKSRIWKGALCPPPSISKSKRSVSPDEYYPLYNHVFRSSFSPSSAQGLAYYRKERPRHLSLSNHRAKNVSPNCSSPPLLSESLPGEVR